MQILRFAEVVASPSEVRETFSQSPIEANLADALMAGGVAGDVDMPRMMVALRAATTAGSAWAPLWLGDVERLQGSTGPFVQADKEDAVHLARRAWYRQAEARGHPDARNRLAGLASAKADPKQSTFNVDTLASAPAEPTEEAQKPLIGALQVTKAGISLAFSGAGELPIRQDMCDTEAFEQPQVSFSLNVNEMSAEIDEVSQDRQQNLRKLVRSRL